ncbi:hypothetical protein S7711_03645 [Stachybotrys chartarum IBT 7711]|uniref:Transcription factor domain-containing protein n=1 Tax=Stachybotrys chartarum (strain CBS 109288 / IBT 7711) TaxID=1280523 RepID=A0A084AH06_STACB|nr:hypothetical protein S7711_03645 [Stachybotrys chartarum IBT 7711]
MLPFLVSTDKSRPDDETRKFIRSHVMLGKNRRKAPLRRSPRTSVEHASPIYAVPSIGKVHQTEGLRTRAGLSMIPGKVGSDLSTIQFADDVDPGVVETSSFQAQHTVTTAYANLPSTTVSSIAKRTLFPLSPYILFKRREENWVEPLGFDPLYLHALIFSTHEYFESVRGGTNALNRRTSIHLHKTLRLLRDRLSGDNDQARLSPSTATVVMTLAAHAHFIGDPTSAKHHLLGLQKIVELRGGITTLSDNTKLVVELLRCDLGIALDSGSTPVFLDEASRLSYGITEPLILDNDLSIDAYLSIMLLRHIDSVMIDVWQVMARFCFLINQAVMSKDHISTELYMGSMCSVMYRLMTVEYVVGSTSEAIRLGLLAFSSSVFLQWKGLGRAYNYLRIRYMSSLVSLNQSDFPSYLLLWLFMVGGISVFGTEEVQLMAACMPPQDTFNLPTSWEEMQHILGGYMWIHAIHDQAGEKMFRSLFIPQ